MGFFDKLFGKKEVPVVIHEPKPEINIGAFFNQQHWTEADEIQLIDDVLNTVPTQANVLDKITEIRSLVAEIRQYKDKMNSESRLYLAEKQRQLITSLQGKK